MPRVTYVKKAQPRFKTVPVLDENGQPKVVPVLRKDGTPKVTKHGRAVTMRVTQSDKTQPLPNLKCDACGKDILPGTPYKWIKPKSGPYGGAKRNRHADCPTWREWEYSNSLSARIAQIQNDWNPGEYEDEDSVRSALDDIAQQVRDLADEKREAASSIEDGFGHPTYQSEELEQQADDLESWADDIEGADVPEIAEFTGCPAECDGGEIQCESCEGSGTIEDGVNGTGSCEECDGKGTLTCDECEGEGENFVRLDDWREEVESTVTIVGESPV